ncbi:MAG: M15 family metallopeptidase [Chlamydiales bacterium]|nr:M15 family metallopeptidase [Chlamydiales bacterium]
MQCNRALIELAAVNHRIKIDLRYATDKNFLGFPVYSKAVCYVHYEVAEALNLVQQELETMSLGLKVFDAYRPLSVQQIMWDKIQDERYVANPAKHKGRHTRGTAVDLTLVDPFNRELEMPTAFDDFTEKAHSDYPHASQEALQNRALLQHVMRKYGFQTFPTEWWHFDIQGWLDDIKFPPLDISFEELLKQVESGGVSM